MGLFNKTTERTRAWAADVRASFHAGGVSHYEGGAPVPHTAATYTVNGVPPHINAIWSYYDAVGDFHSGAKFFAACLSRCTLRLGVRDVDNNIGPAFGEDGKPLPGVPVRLANLGALLIASVGSAPGMTTADGPVGGHSMILGNIGKHLYSTGVCWLVAKKTSTGDNWEVLSTSELVPIQKERADEKQRFKRRRHLGGQFEDWTPDFYLRIFDPHPAASGDPDSSAVPLLSILERLALLDAEGLADSKSRLKGPGILWVPSEMDFPATDDDPEGDKYLQRELIQTASIGIKDPSSASRHVPLVVGAAGERIAQVLHQRFDYDGDALIEKRGAAMGDLARGLPLPYEAVTGYGETSMANAFAIDEQLVRIYAMPPLDLITGFMTGGWFTNALMLATNQSLDGPPSDDVRRFVVWYDVSGLVNAPDPAKLAMWAYGTDTNPNGLISAKGARRLTGIPEGEAPSDEEIERRIAHAQKLRARSEKGDNTPDTDPDDPMPEDRQDGERDKDEEIGKRVVGTAQAVAEIAASQAGNKLRSKVAKSPELTARIDGVDAADVARVLGPAVVESLGGTAPLLNGTFTAFERTVLADFSEAGRDDAAELATAACKMAKVATLARLKNPTARLDAKMAQEFLDLLLNGRSQ